MTAVGSHRISMRCKKRVKSAYLPFLCYYLWYSNSKWKPYIIFFQCGWTSLIKDSHIDMRFLKLITNTAPNPWKSFRLDGNLLCSNIPRLRDCFESQYAVCECVSVYIYRLNLNLHCAPLLSMQAHMEWTLLTWTHVVHFKKSGESHMTMCMMSQGRVNRSVHLIRQVLSFEMHTPAFHESSYFKTYKARL